MVAKVLLVTGISLSTICALFAFIVFSVGWHYRADADVWSGLLLFGAIGALPVVAILVQIHVYLARRHKRSADRRVVLLGLIVGAVMMLGGILMMYQDSGDYFIYLPFALVGGILLWACRPGGPTRPLRGHPPLEGEG
jgi:hypothetical protein